MIFFDIRRYVAIMNENLEIVDNFAIFIIYEIAKILRELIMILFDDEQRYVNLYYMCAHYRLIYDDILS